MADAPFRERRLSPEEVQRVLKRACELASSEPAGDVGEPLSVAELEERLAQLGIPQDVARRAMQPVAPAPAPSADGGMRIEREVILEGMIDPARFDEIADAIAAVMKSEGRTSAVGNKLTWTPGGVLMEPAITVQAKDGHTRVRYVETLANAGQVKLGFGALAGFGGLIAGALGSAILQAATATGPGGSPLVATTGIFVGVGAAVASYLGLQRMLARRARTRAALADVVMDRVGARVRAVIASAAVKTRVEIDDEAEREEAEAEAEVEQAERERAEGS